MMVCRRKKRFAYPLGSVAALAAFQSKSPLLRVGLANLRGKILALENFVNSSRDTTLLGAENTQKHCQASTGSLFAKEKDH